MNTKEMLLKMKDKLDAEEFGALVESMKRKANKGLLEGVNSAELEKILNEIYSEKQEEESFKTPERCEIMALVSEISEAVDNFDKRNEMLLEELSDNELEDLFVYVLTEDAKAVFDNIKNGLSTAGAAIKNAAEKASDHIGLTTALKKIGKFTGVSISPLAAMAAAAGISVRALIRMIRKRKQKKFEKQKQAALADPQQQVVTEHTNLQERVRDVFAALGTEGLEQIFYEGNELELVLEEFFPYENEPILESAQNSEINKENTLESILMEE